MQEEGKYKCIECDVIYDIAGDSLREPSIPFRQWIRHTASVPKGLLRYYVLRLLKEKPMSGSEIVEEIAKETGGRWRPSPGSLYPLLGWLQENRYTRETPTEETGMKRYMLTEKGGKFFQEQTHLKERLEKRLESWVPQLLSGFWLSSHPEKMRKLREPTRRFLKALIGLRATVEHNPTDQALREVEEFLEKTAERIEEMRKDLGKRKLSR